MNDFSTLRLRYTQILGICLLASLLYVLSQSLSGEFANFETNLPGRQFLIENFTRLRLKIGDHVFNGGLVGKDGWLVYTANFDVENFQNVPVLPVGGIENIQKNLTILYNRLRERNITLVVVIAPNKATIYPDKLPSEIKKIGSKSELDLLVDLLQKDGPPVLIDLRSALQEERQKRDVYYKTDTHWNAYGALIAYREILKRLSMSYPELAPNKINSFSITTTKPYEHDISRVIGAYHLLEPGYTVVPAQNDLNWVIYNNDLLKMKIATSSQNKLPKLLIYADSFGSTLVPLLAPHFSQSTIIHNDSLYPDILTFQQIEASKPDIVILEFVERFQFKLYHFLNNYGLEAIK
jgi:alginate O-acetyltransferase complex protein AlgJ